MAIAPPDRVSLTDHLKGRIAEALVESLFRQHGYKVARLGRESGVQRLVKTGPDEFLPDFLVWKHVRYPDAPDLHRFLNVEAKYRANLPKFLYFDGAELFSRAKDQWPNLYFVLVTDSPEANRSCFQVVCLRDYIPGSLPTTIDLDQTLGLDIVRSVVEEHEIVAQQLFAALAAGKMPPRRAASREISGVILANGTRSSR